MKTEGSTVHLAIADHDMEWMMQALQGLNSHKQIKVTVFANTGRDLVERVASMDVDAVLMEYSMPDMTAVEVVKKLAEDSPGTLIFAVTNSLTEQLLRTAKSAGVKEVFFKPNFSPAEAGNRIVAEVDAFRRELSLAAQKHGRIEKGTGPIGVKIQKEYVTRTLKQVVVLTHNIKGGVGKSTIAVNLAAAIKMSPYYSGQRVCLVDFDCGGANVATYCHINDNATYNRNIYNWLSVSPDVSAREVEEMLIKGPQGIMIAAAPINLAHAEKISYDLADKILKILKNYFTVIVIDGAPNLSAPIDSAMLHATHILLVANAEGQSVRQLAKTVALFSPEPDFPEKPDMSHILNKMFLVVNYAQAPTEYDLKKADIASVVGRPLIAEIPYDKTVRKALHGPYEKVAVELDPGSDFSLAIKKLSNDICGAYPDGIRGEDDEKKPSKGLFSRLLGR
ncbi:AAA family ATPase [Thermanaerosceptrum fracticalcis]|uniref:Stage 0 sporulation protein A homolog n=1 Tax=Thermanaerosceptrum fracticalcis TaxID=1712410 RepID=A0A7G6DZW8_THEFR|nr:AAA family ATPase [Thermanaerosceptrum fracticalcis]QNB45372.1 AAA family ATPase [Thermanaerosceptrum fracticalcis]